jgi:hypothetical protein
MTSAHRSIWDSTFTLPDSSGDRDNEFNFDAPGLSSATATHARPYFSYRVNPVGNVDVHVQVELNGTLIVDQTIDSTVSRTFNEIVGHGILRSRNNELRVFVPNNEPGSVIVSDLIMVYTEA